MRSIVILLVLSSLPLACSSGGGSSPGPIASGGIGGTGSGVTVVRGPITGFGSIFVGGVEWETEGAAVSIDDAPGSDGDLALGMVVTVRGSVDDNTSRGVASDVEYDDDIEGPVSQVTLLPGDGRVKELSVLGTIVVVDEDSTVFASSGAGFAFASVSVDDVVKVSGLTDESGRLRASRIEKTGVVSPAGTPVEIKGSVSDFDGVDQFRLAGIVIRFDPTGVSTDLTDLPSGVANGLFVEVEGILDAAGDVSASRIELENENVTIGGVSVEGDDVEIEGFITTFQSLGEFSIGGQAVDASSATLRPNDPTLFRAGVRVQVEGRLNSGVLVARELELRQSEIRLAAEIDTEASIDASTSRFTLLGVTVTVDAGTQTDDEIDDDQQLSVGSLSPGDYLEVRGFLGHDGSVIATTLRRREDSDDVELQGRVETFDVAARTVTILGQTVPTDATTEFQDESDTEIGADAFFSRIRVGDLVKVSDDEDDDNASIDQADEVEFELDS